MKISLVIIASLITSTTAFATDCAVLAQKTQSNFDKKNARINKILDKINEMEGDVSAKNCATAREFVNTTSPLAGNLLLSLHTEIENLKAVCPQAKINNEGDLSTLDEALEIISATAMPLGLATEFVSSAIEECEKEGL